MHLFVRAGRPPHHETSPVADDPLARPFYLSATRGGRVSPRPALSPTRGGRGRPRMSYRRTSPKTLTTPRRNETYPRRRDAGTGRCRVIRLSGELGPRRGMGVVYKGDPARAETAPSPLKMILAGSHASAQEVVRFQGGSGSHRPALQHPKHRAGLRGRVPQRGRPTSRWSTVPAAAWHTG